ncbi:NPP1 family protein [Pseudomonas sp. SORGH_AS_0211]|uniref:NPP1 family protein n=1 Tax=Pseudomonas sp. SORGH_AS_0211 TaxID=3041796 RepID=UPI00286A1FD3|nr:NPP1 family protein [Pseudomonas sp. SORGH_AS_0211]
MPNPLDRYPPGAYQTTYKGFAGHSPDATHDVGRSQALISWSRLPVPARNTLNGNDLGAANVRFKAGGAFWSNLQKARQAP